MRPGSGNRAAVVLGVAIGTLTLTHDADSADYFVSPRGRDIWSGTVPEPNADLTDGPFATLVRARDEIRRAGPATIHIRGGRYRLADTFRLAAEDRGTAQAPVVYRAYRGETPILTGGMPITGFAPHQGQILKADTKGQFRQLYFEGERQTLARYPNLDPADPITSGWAFVDSGPAPRDALDAVGAKRVLKLKAQDAREWARATDGEVFIFPSHEWWNNIVRIQAVDRERRLITLRRECSYEIKPENRYFVRGLREELDAPGEWYLDRAAGVLYFWPPRPIAPGEDLEVWGPKLKTLVEIGPGAAHITFRGLTLECCAGTAVAVKDAEHCLIAGCTVRNTTGYHGSGISVRGGKANGVVGCDIHDVGSTGIFLAGGDQRTLSPAGNYAENSHITRVGLDYRQGSGIVLSGVGNRASRNTIHDVPRWCLQFGGNNNVIELNHLYRASLETSDTGAIYGGSLNWLSAHGTVIRHNFIHDVVGRGRRKGEWWAPFYAWGIYLDWTAMGVTVHGNIVTRCPRAGIMVHDGRFNTIENNIIVDCGIGAHDARSQIELSGWHTGHYFWKRGLAFGWVKQYETVAEVAAWQRVSSLRDPRTLGLPDGRTMFGNRIRRNILAYRDPKSVALRFRNVPKDHNACDRNLIWHFGQPIRTGLFRVKDTNGPNLVLNPGFEDGLAAWRCRLTSNDARGEVDAETRHSGVQSLRLRGVVSPANAGKPDWLRQVAASCSHIKGVIPGRAYRALVWLKAGQKGTRARLEALSYKSRAYDVRFSREIVVGTEWTEHSVAFRFPQRGDGNYHEGMDKTFYIRVTLHQDAGTLWIDDAELREATVLDEWQAWQNEGWDRRSIIADPLFVDPQRDDYRLKPESPALKLGFKPIPVEKIGCYQDPLRASWPLEAKRQ